MNVLSLKEPFATLIKNNIKYIETRSWKTEYRGELYIHASKSKVDKNVYSRKELIKLFDEDELQYGSIICKCELVDCIKITEEYAEYIKNNDYQQYICGDYTVGRYAWILKNIEPLDRVIPAKGKLYIWKYEEKTTD